jgi:hypothetical protein
MGLLVSSIPDRGYGMKMERRKHPSLMAEVSIPYRGYRLVLKTTQLPSLSIFYHFPHAS